jgi:hypothetical protein
METIGEMHFTDACGILRPSTEPSTVRFVSPIMSSMIAAAHIRQEDRQLTNRVFFSGDAQTYAANNGLLDVLKDRYEFPKRTGSQGVTYSKLTRLSTHAEVEVCNQVANDLVCEHLNSLSQNIAAKVCGVVGELHDNVASHARGTGFSCAQVYTSGVNRRLEFAIADAGCGMLANVNRINNAICTDDDAIRWCLQRGHTTASSQDDWAQRLPDDADFNPFPSNVEITRNENHHVGEGLWRLFELVKLLEGKIWISSGTGSFFWQGGKELSLPNRINWNGVAIEFEINVRPLAAEDSGSQARLEELAKRMGL